MGEPPGPRARGVRRAHHLGGIKLTRLEAAVGLSKPWRCPADATGRAYAAATASTEQPGRGTHAMSRISRRTALPTGFNSGGTLFTRFTPALYQIAAAVGTRGRVANPPVFRTQGRQTGFD